MGHTLAIGQRLYSSWSLRGWLLFAAFDIPVRVRMAEMYSPRFAEVLSGDFAPARTVPALTSEPLGVVWDTLAIAETLAETHPGMWPASAPARAFARSITAEMHAGFGALRGACPMNLSHVWQGFTPQDGVLDDLARLEALWAQARRDFGGEGPWLFGAYSIADAFFAPVAARIAGYDLPVGAEARRYVEAHLSERHFRQWRATGLAAGEHLSNYDMDLERGPWPGPAPRVAKPVTGKPALNTHCPYSGEPISQDALLEIDGSVIGFCNPLCRDKTAADPEAWPKAMALLP